MMPRLCDLDPADRHRAVAERFAEHVAAVPDWDAATPVAGWCAWDVVDHLIGWSREFLRAGGVALPVDQPRRDDPGAAWGSHCVDVQALLEGPESAAQFTHPYAGTHQLAEAIDRFYTPDVFMHTWDLAMSTGRDPLLDPQFAATLVDGMSAMEDVLRSSGQYGPAVAVPADADPVTRMACFIGRDPQWRP
ncbi:MAG: TIGR03086 family protein [Mycolicibacterium rufum]|uniref:Mycothiol-dependent maleylpyruvate isomerase metal-binding domain-containing protein n=1 Tax=Mycolicibacterium chlorophenolicum TaxID=37916 RepID=A0A0J6VJK7_9MYCO|nr:maleylpyruvate isomerase N-terminal domain-containing protein [Mycolicibacterium chlorophenolicum]KMO70439.1 hypothetical protein MCHLDSM_05327 [Mycolicibacterium chlorophenolicum]MBI5341527.1 TIGR03086 family protein [Mycolicibacterium rufum]